MRRSLHRIGRLETEAAAPASVLMNRRRFSAVLGALGAALTLPALAQAWPARPIRLIVPFPPGGGTDVISRQLAERMAANTGWSIVVENRAGAGGNIGLDAVAKAAPDGYTIGMGQASNLAVNPALYARMPFDPLKDLAPVAPVASQGLIAVVSAAAPFSSLGDLMAAARGSPDRVSLAHAGNGTIGHLAGEMLARQARARMLIVPYKGIAPAVTELMGGQVDVLFGNPLAVMPLVTGGQLRPVAVSSARRLAALPAVPTVAEQGFPGFEAVNWSGLVAPAHTPDAVIAQLNAQAVAALHRPEMLERLALDGSEPFSGSAAEFAAFMRNEAAKWGAIVRDIGLRVE
jgi:tripartite-type tricarboxylate transporter receptor subunit TctC